MNLIELVKYLINPEELDSLYEEFDVNVNSEALLIYMKDSLDLKSNISIFEIEKTNDRLHFIDNGINYYQLFHIEYAIELVESDLELKNNGYTNEYIAKRLLEYRLNDA